MSKERKTSEQAETGNAALGVVSLSFSPVVARRLLKIRESLIQRDINEAYHQLRMIADPNTEHLDHWAELEKIAKGVNVD